MAKKKFKSDVQLEGEVSLPNKTPERALALDSSGNIVESLTTEAELALLSGTTSNVQSQLDAKIDDSEKGAANGVATLDAGSKIPSSQLPAIAITEVFVAADITARDALVVGTGDGEVQEGDVVKVTDASADAAITSGAASYIYDGSAYVLLKAGDEVLSVNGETGVVTLNSDDISEGSTNLYYTEGRFDTSFSGKSTTDLSEGTNLYFTDERAQDAIGNNLVDSASVDFTYNDVAGNITAAVLPAGVDHDSLSGFIANEHIDHSSIEVETVAGSGLSGGGDLTSTRSLAVDIVGTGTTISVEDTDSLLIHDDSSGIIRQITRANFLSGVSGGSAGDIEETSAAFLDNQVTFADVTGLSFAAGTVRSFDIHVTVERNTLFETFRLQGVQLASGFVMSVDSTGDDSGVAFDVTSAGQVQYTSTSTGDAGTIKFRAETLTV